MMDQEWNRTAIIQGNRSRREHEENPTTFAMYDGEVDPGSSQNLAATNSIRKAGPGGVFALNLMANPEAAVKTDKWMREFGQSVPGAEFNSAKLQQAQQVSTAAMAEQQLYG